MSALKICACGNFFSASLQRFLSLSMIVNVCEIFFVPVKIFFKNETLSFSIILSATIVPIPTRAIFFIASVLIPQSSSINGMFSFSIMIPILSPAFKIVSPDGRAEIMLSESFSFVS